MERTTKFNFKLKLTTTGNTEYFEGIDKISYEGTDSKSFCI